MLRLWIAELDGGRDLPMPPLSAYRLRRLEGVRAPGLRRQMLAAETLLVRALRELDIGPPLDIQTAEGGKPCLREGLPRFSLSHSEDFVACAVADYEIGVDIQKGEKLDERLVRRFFTEEEQRFLRGSENPDEDFTALWCCKESYLKALGTGLSRPLDSFTVRLGEPPVIPDVDDVRFWLRRGQRYALALCSLDGFPAEPERIHYL